MYGKRVPDDVAAILDRACAEDPRQRYSDAAEFRRAVTAALHRRKPGYGAEDLARDIDVLRNSDEIRSTGKEPTEVELHDEFDLSDEPEQTRRHVQPKKLVTAPLPPPERYAPPPPALPAPTEPVPMLARKTPVRALALVTAASAAVLTFAIILLVALRAPAAPRFSSLPLASAPVAPPLAPAKSTTGLLAVEGPPGTAVSIGSTNYPSAPCRVELPAGRYTVKLRRSHARAVTRVVTIEAGRSIALRL
jgi:hypothetical protein